MGYIKHHAIIVSAGRATHIEKSHQRAIDMFGKSMISELVHSPTNAYVSFFIAPDGSKEGWGDSDTGDEQRAEYIKYLSMCEGYVDYVELFYGDDEGEAGIVNHN